jgi:hypothetical protein
MERISFFCDTAELSLMQVTDLHLALRYPLKRFFLHKLARLVKTEDPQLLINSGDFFCRRKITSPVPIIRLFDHYIGTYVPWTFAWGNHDLEIGRKGREARLFEKVEKALLRSNHCLYAKSSIPRPSSTGGDAFTGGNFVIEIFQRGEEKPSWQIFILNSGRKQHITKEVSAAMEEEICRYERSVPGICFFHRPIKETDKAMKRGFFKGAGGERADCGNENGRLHAELKDLGTIKACFYGHDHVNNFFFRKNGIAYVYGRKTLPFAYGSSSLSNLDRSRQKDPRTIAWGFLMIKLPLSQKAFQEAPAIEITSILENRETEYRWQVPLKGTQRKAETFEEMNITMTC